MARGFFCVARKFGNVTQGFGYESIGASSRVCLTNASATRRLASLAIRSASASRYSASSMIAVAPSSSSVAWISISPALNRWSSTASCALAVVAMTPMFVFPQLSISPSLCFGFCSICLRSLSEDRGFGFTAVRFGSPFLCFGKEPIGFEAVDFGFPFESSGFGLEHSGFACESIGFGLEALGFGLEALGFGLEALGFGLEALGFVNVAIGFGTVVIGFGFAALCFLSDCGGFEFHLVCFDFEFRCFESKQIGGVLCARGGEARTEHGDGDGDGDDLHGESPSLRFLILCCPASWVESVSLVRASSLRARGPHQWDARGAVLLQFDFGCAIPHVPFSKLVSVALWGFDFVGSAGFASMSAVPAFL